VGVTEVLKYILALIILVVIIAGYSVWRFNLKAKSDIEALFLEANTNGRVITEDMLRDLPAPVQRWLIHCGVVGKEEIQTVYLKQRGEMKLKPGQDKWIKSEAEQSFNAIQPQFTWRVKTSMFGLPVVGRDDFANGKGKMLIKLAGLIPVVNLADDPKLSESTMQRYLGEIIWFPTAALNPYITWEAIDDSSARAMMEYAGVKGSATFYFDEKGEPVRVLMSRYRDINDKEPTDWEAEIKRVESVNGIVIPVEVGASWLPEEGKFTWYVFEVYDISYKP
jgi:hypothetical protein